MKIRICCPSYGRADALDTAKYIPSVSVFVDPSEFEAYRKLNPGAHIVKCPRGVQGKVPRTRNYILNSSFKAGADVVVLLDDDLQGIYIWEKRKSGRRDKILIDADNFERFIEKYSIMAQDMGAYLWGVHIAPDKMLYKPFAPFSTNVFIGGPFQVVLRGCVLRYDERFPLKDDYDFCLQHLNHYRKILRVNKGFFVAKQSEQKGGCATFRTMARETEEFKRLQAKWGATIVRTDYLNRSAWKTKARTKNPDYNPILHIPIAGV
jgi:hypothetical protein